MKTMKILITGGTGFIGKALIKHLLQKNNNLEIRLLSRKAKKSFNHPSVVKVFKWNLNKETIEKKALNEVDIVIHLAGESIAGRWTSNKKKKIVSSRINSTQVLLKHIKEMDKPPKKLIGASAIGIYGDQKDKILDEQAPVGKGFLAGVCQKWEKSLFDHHIKNMKTHCLRIGFVLGKEGGGLKSMLLPFKMGLGGKIGDGKQFISWIHIKDLLNQITFLIENDHSKPIYNAISPNPITNAFFTKTLGKILNQPTFIPIPSLVLKLLLGEMSGIILESQRVSPHGFLEEGFNYEYPDLEKAIRNILKR